MKKEDGTKILFINVLRYIETGENANITINGKKYNVSVNKNDGKYYIEEESFENRQDFIDELYNKTSVMLTDNSVVILNYIADGTLKIDSSWQFYDKNYEQEKNKISKLYKRAIINLIILYFFIIVVNSLILLELSSLTENNLYTKIFTFDINKKIIAIFFIINSISIICCKSNINSWI